MFRFLISRHAHVMSKKKYIYIFICLYTNKWNYFASSQQATLCLLIPNGGLKIVYIN